MTETAARLVEHRRRINEPADRAEAAPLLDSRQGVANATLDRFFARLDAPETAIAK